MGVRTLIPFEGISVPQLTGKVGESEQRAKTSGRDNTPFLMIFESGFASVFGLQQGKSLLSELLSFLLLWTCALLSASPQRGSEAKEDDEVCGSH